MSKKLNNFLISNKKIVRKVCYAWIALALLGAVLSTNYFIFADWSAIQSSKNFGLMPAQYMPIVGMSIYGVLAVYMLIPIWVILGKIKKLSC